jgi:ATP-dependent Clp protease adaptor protein ClpS
MTGPTIVSPDLDEDVIARLQSLPPFKVIVVNCDCHSFDDVERALCRVIPGMTREKAHQHAWEIHTEGASVVARAPKEQAEMYHERLVAHTMHALIERD